MGYRCCVGICDNDSRYQDKVIKRGNADTLNFHKFPIDLSKRNIWVSQISKGRANFNPGPYTYVCSNHFVDGKPTTANPNPTLFLTISDNKKSSPLKRPYKDRDSSHLRRKIFINDVPEPGSKKKVPEHPEPVPMFFAHICQEYNIRFFTGFKNAIQFKTIFDHVSKKAAVMTYWDGVKKTLANKKGMSPYEKLDKIVSFIEFDSQEDPFEIDYASVKRGPSRKLSLEQEFLLTMMKLRLGLMALDLAFRFQILQGKVSQIFITWIKLLSKELGVLIIWPSNLGQIAATMPECFKRLYPRVQVIIDCTEIFTETPSSLEVQAVLWSDYKHNCTIKYLVCITPNGAISWLSPTYGGRCTDVFIVRDSGFLRMLEPYSQVMTDRGFKIKTDLAMVRCTLCIPPSAAKGIQMTSDEVKETSQIANVRIYVEQAIKRMKDYRILKSEMSLLLLPVCDDIIKVCAALCNLKEPLAK